MAKKVTASGRRITPADLDKRIHGDEPFFNEMPEDSARNITLIKVLNYFDQKFDPKTAPAVIKKWLKSQEYFDLESIGNVDKLNLSNTNPTIYSLIRMEQNGWILSDSEIQKIKTQFVDLGKSITAESLEEDASVKKPAAKVSPMTLVVEKTKEKILPELEGILDQWLFSNSVDEKKSQVNLVELFMTAEIKSPQGLSSVADWVDEKLLEFNVVKKIRERQPSNLDEEMGQIREGYSNIRTVDLNRLIRNLEALKAAIPLVRTSLKGIKAATKPGGPKKRVKSQTAIAASNEKKAAKIKFLQTSKDYNVASVSPSKIYGKTILYLFNTKYRKLSRLVSKEGFDSTGTTIKNLVDEECKSWTLRKPNEILSKMMIEKSATGVQSILDGLTTKPQSANGRINADTVILRVF